MAGKNGNAITFVLAASALNGTIGAAVGRKSCCGPDACVFAGELPWEWHGGVAL
jgi:hypothetical protein